MVPQLLRPRRRWRERLWLMPRRKALTPVVPLVPRATLKNGGECLRRVGRTRCWRWTSPVGPLVPQVIRSLRRMCLSRALFAHRSRRKHRRLFEARKRHKCLWLCRWELHPCFPPAFRCSLCRTCVLHRARLRHRFVGWATAQSCKGSCPVGPLGPQSAQYSLLRRHRPVVPLVPQGSCERVCPRLRRHPSRRSLREYLWRLCWPRRHRPVVPLVARARYRCCLRAFRRFSGGGLPGTSRRRCRLRQGRKHGQKRRRRRHGGGKLTGSLQGLRVNGCGAPAAPPGVPRAAFRGYRAARLGVEQALPS